MDKLILKNCLARTSINVPHEIYLIFLTKLFSMILHSWRSANVSIHKHANPFPVLHLLLYILMRQLYHLNSRGTIDIFFPIYESLAWYYFFPL